MKINIKKFLCAATLASSLLGVGDVSAMNIESNGEVGDSELMFYVFSSSDECFDSDADVDSMEGCFDVDEVEEILESDAFKKVKIFLKSESFKKLKEFLGTREFKNVRNILKHNDFNTVEEFLGSEAFNTVKEFLNLGVLNEVKGTLEDGYGLSFNEAVEEEISEHPALKALNENDPVNDDLRDCALLLAVKTGHFDIKKRLEEKCAYDLSSSIISFSEPAIKEILAYPVYSAAYNGILGTIQVYLPGKNYSYYHYDLANESLGNFALLIASKKGHFDIVKYLVEECDADVECKDIQGRTPLDIAKTDEIKEYLRSKKSEQN